MATGKCFVLAAVIGSVYTLSDAVKVEAKPVSRITLSEAHKAAEHKYRIPLVTVETRRPEAILPMPGVPGRTFINLGANQSWTNLFTKPKIFLKWLEQRPNPKEIVIFADASDVLFGGCTDDQLLASYAATVKASGGAPVVMGAEMGLDPPPLGAWVDPHGQFHSRRAEVQSLLGLNDASYGSLATCTDSSPEPCTVPTKEEARAGNWPCGGPCSSPPSMTYVNSGFIIGPVAEVKEVVRGMVLLEQIPENSPFVTNWHDQGAATLFMAEKPHLMTLDYNGALVLNMHQFPVDKLVEAKDGSLHNKVTGMTQCMLHANGPALPKLTRILTDMGHTSELTQ